MEILDGVSVVTTIAASVIASIYWLCASRVKIPSFPDVGFDSDSSVFLPVKDALDKGARLNTVAAAWSGIAAMAEGVNVLLQHVT